MKFQPVLSNAILKDSTKVGITQVAGVLINILYISILSRSLSIDQFGHYQLMMSYLGIATVFSLPGFSTAMIKASAHQFDNLFFIGLKRKTIGSLVAFLLFIAIGIAYIFYFKNMELGVLFLFTSSFLLVQVLRFYESVLIGKKLFWLSRLLNIVFYIVRLVIIGFVAWHYRDIKLILVAGIVIELIFGLVGVFITANRISSIPRNKDLEKEYKNMGYRFTALSALGIISGKIEKLILGMINPETLAIYYIGAVIPAQIKDNLKPVLGVVSTHWLYLSKQDNIKRIWKFFTIFIIAGTLIVVCNWLVAPFIIQLLFGQNYSESIWITRWLGLPLGFFIFTLMITNLAIYQGHERFYTKVRVVTNIFKIALYILLIPIFGIRGVVFTAILTEGFYSLVIFSWFIIKTKTDIPKT